MKNTFDISRFGKFFAMELRLHRKTYLVMIAMALALILIQIVSSHFIHNSPVTPNLWWSIVLSHVLIIFAPFVLYDFIYHPTKGMMHTLLPASSAEKFVSALMQCIVVLPFLLGTTIFISGCLADLFGTNIYWADEKTLRFFTEDYFSAVISQAIFFLGVFWFKRRKISKTILTIILIAVATSFISMIIVRIIGEEVLNEMFENFALRFIENGEMNFRTLGRILAIAYPVTLWAIAFFKFRRTQI